MSQQNIMNHFGALPDHLIRQCISEGILYNGTLDNVNPSSYDLRTDLNTLQEIPCVFTPSKKNDPISKTLEKLGAKKVQKTNDGFLIQRGKVYVAEIVEEIKTQDHMFVRTNPKSSTGRSDIHVQLLADMVARYDRIHENWSAKMYVLFRSNSFDVLVPDDCVALNQLRIFKGNLGILTTDELQCLAVERKILRNDHKEKYLMLTERIREDRIELSVDLRDWGKNGFLGYIAKQRVKESLIWKKQTNDPDTFFTPIKNVMGDRTYQLNAMRFYILSCRESVYIPNEYACEMIALDDTRGELRPHYAGFIDNGWGSPLRDGKDGHRPLTLEVRAYEPTLIYHGQPITSIMLNRMYAPVERGYDDMGTSNYTTQDRALLGKFFRQK